jgi:hypothetical protein
LLLLAAAAPAQALDVVPRVTLGAIVTDNVRLSPKELEESDVIGLVQPGITIQSQGNRYDFYLDYALQAFFYADQEESDQTFSIGNTRLGVDILPETFRVTGVASIAQTIIAPDVPAPAGNLPIVANRQDQTIVQVTPEWRQRLGAAEGNFSFTAGRVMFGESQFEDIPFQEWRNTIDGPDRERGLTWALSHQYGAYDYTTIELKRQSVDLSLFSNLGSNFVPFVTVGVESDFADPTTATLDFFTWYAGLRYGTPSTTAEVAYGERSFGNNVRLSLRRQAADRPGNFIQASYTETPQTPANLASAGQLPPPGTPIIPGQPPPLDPGFPTDQPPLILPPALAQSFLTKRGQVAVGRQMIRSRFRVTLFAEDLESVPFVGQPSQDAFGSSQTGVTGNYSYDIGSRVTFQAFLTITDQEFSQGDTVTTAATVIFGRLGLDFQLGQKTKLSTWVGTNRWENVSGTSNQAGFEQNSLGVFLTRSFF